MGKKSFHSEETMLSKHGLDKSTLIFVAVATFCIISYFEK